MPIGVYKRTQSVWNKGLTGVQIAWNKGKKLPSLSVEHKRKISEKLKGKKRPLRTEEHKKNLSKSLAGRTVWNKGLPSPYRGEASPSWRGGLTSLNQKIRNSTEYKLWRVAVFKRDNWTCIWCNDRTGGNLNADHIKSFSLHPELRLKVENGRTLCIPCHKKTKTYGWNPYVRGREKDTIN